MYSKKIFLASIFLLIVGLTGCKQEETDKNLLLFRDTFKNMQTANNYRVDSTVSIVVNNEGGSATISTYYDLTDDKNGNIKITNSVDDEEKYVEITNGRMKLYSETHTGWTNQKIDEDDFSDLGGMRLSSDDLEFLNKNIEYNIIAESSKKVTYEIYLKNNKSIKEALGLQTSITLMHQFNLSQDELNTLFDEFRYVVAIDPENKVLLRIDLDFTQILRRLLVDANRSSQGAYNLESFRISYGFSNYQNVNVSIPGSNN